MKTVSQVFDFVVCPPGSSEDHFMFGRFSALLYLEHDLKIKQKNKIENNQQWQVPSPLAGNKTKQNKTKQNLTTKITTESKVLRQMSGTCLKIESLMACHSI